MLWFDGPSKELRMAATPPVLYLDHGPMGQIAEDVAYASRLAAVIAKGGTLALSQANLMEIANQGDGASLDAIRRLLTSIGTGFCFIRTDPLAHANAAASHGADTFAAAMDFELAADYARDRGVAPGQRLDASTFVSQLRDSTPEEIRDFVRTSKLNFASILRRAQERFRTEGWLPKVREGEPRALECYAALIRIIAKEKIDLAKPNDGLDVLHAAVPISACDLVVLDAGWAELARRVPQPPRRAEVFSGKKGQIEAFLAAAENVPNMPTSFQPFPV